MNKVLLVGMMGAGKTSVGTLLAQRLECPYLDNDSLLERTAGASAGQLLERDGVEALRAAESQVLTLVLGMPGPLVAGVAGGVVLDEGDRTRLRASGCHIVWLRATPAVLARRIGAGQGRPWLDGDPVAALRALAADRNPHYAEVATQVIDVDALPAGAVAKVIVAALG